MSQRAVLRGFVLCLLTVLAAGLAEAQTDVQPLVVNPGRIQVRQGGQSFPATATVTAFATGAPVSGVISFSGLPQGVVSVPATIPYSVPQGQSSVTVSFRLAATLDAPVGLYYEIGVMASPIQAYAWIEVEVLPGITPPVGALEASVAKGAISLCTGGDPVGNSVMVTPVNGYRGSPTMTFGGVPAGVVISPSPIAVPVLPPARSVEFQVSATAAAPAGVHTIQVVVKDPVGAAATTSFTVEVLPFDFKPAVAPASLVVGAGGAPASVTASILPGTCSPPASITVTPTGVPPGVTVSPASAVLEAPDFTPVSFAFSAAAGTAASTGTVTMTFTPSSGPAKSAPLPYTVRLLGSLAAEVANGRVEVCAGSGFEQNTLTVTPVDGYEGSPTVSFPNLPAGVTVSQVSIPLPPLPPARSVSFGVSADAGTPPGPRTVTVVVTDPLGPTATTSFTVDVRPPVFTPAVSPASVPLNAGGEAGSLTASIVPGACPPTADVTVAPSGLPPGITVTPASAVLAAPGFDPVTFAVRAAAGAAPGPSTLAFSFTPLGGTATTGNAEVVVCGTPPAPTGPRITPKGNPAGPVTATDFLVLSWGPPASPFPATRYEYRVNGEAWAPQAGLEAAAPPRGKVDPVQLFVRAYSCTPEAGPGAEAASPVYPLAPPVASFSFPATITVGMPVTFTDTSSPQATSWLWFLGDGAPATTVQSPTVTFTSAGPKVVVLVATNGSGSSTKTVTVNVFPPTGLRATASAVTRALEPAPDGRLALDGVVVADGTALLLRRLSGTGEAVAFLRLVDGEGRTAVERRLVLAEGEEARHDLSAFARGTFRVEVVGPSDVEAAVEESAVPLGGADLPVTPGRPRVGR